MEWLMIIIMRSVLDNVLEIWFGILVICSFCCKNFISSVVNVDFIIDLELL